MYVLMSSEREDLQDWSEKLNRCCKLIIVEGIKDKASLRAIGIRNRIFCLNKKPLYAVVEEVAKTAKDVVILTDLDRTGKQIYRKLCSDLQYHGVRVDRFFREFLFKKTKLRQIEGIVTYKKKLSPQAP